MSYFDATPFAHAGAGQVGGGFHERPCSDSRLTRNGRVDAQEWFGNFAA